MKVVKDPNYAPVYCALYPQLAEITRRHGYALAIHGTMSRDFDLICVPWVTSPSEPKTVLEEFVNTFDLHLLYGPTPKVHGREAWTILIGHGHCAIDLSFMPRRDEGAVDPKVMSEREACAALATKRADAWRQRVGEFARERSCALSELAFDIRAGKHTEGGAR